MFPTIVRVARKESYMKALYRKRNAREHVPTCSRRSGRKPFCTPQQFKFFAGMKERERARLAAASPDHSIPPAAAAPVGPLVQRDLFPAGDCPSPGSPSSVRT